MKIIADVSARFTHLEALSKDPLVINEDGTKVEPFLEIAAELYGVPVKQVSFDQRNWAIKIVNQALQADILRQASSSVYNQQAQAAAAAFSNQRPWNQGWPT